MRFFDKAMKANGVPEKVNMDKSGANKAAMDEINDRGEPPVIVRQVTTAQALARNRRSNPHDPLLSGGGCAGRI